MKWRITLLNFFYRDFTEVRQFSARALDCFVMNHPQVN